jgi:hypothetical protein
MVAASFQMASQDGLLLAILGLSLLSIQAACNKTWNLLLLNFCSIIGFCYAIFYI